MTKDKLSRSRELAAKVLFAALGVLKEKGGELPGREVIREVENRTSLDEWAKEVYEKSGYVRWQSILHFFSIDAIKAGYLIKKKGIWYLTPEGDNALQLGPVGLLHAASAAYAYSNPSRPLIPTQVGHPFRRNAATDSEPKSATFSSLLGIGGRHPSE